ncbi:MAG: translocation/assembly module TamB domain-containing protein [Geminicoccaceae bacterium]|nr:translocation/assembly module TamB domain-containing protein [Geminicoccaceae bacterium]
MLKTLLKFVLIAVLVVVAIVALAFGYLQTPWGKAQIAELIGDSATSETQTVEVEDITGLVPFDMTIGAMRVGDPEGVWLTVNDARLDVAFWPLLTGAVHVREVGAADMVVARTPQTPEQPREPFSLPEPPQLPESLPEVTVDRLHVDRLELQEPVLGRAATFTVEGTAATTDGTQLDASLDARRIDEETATAALKLDLDLAARTLGLDVQAQETGGLLAQATGRPEAGNLDLSLVGKGPLDAWHADLNVEAERLMSAEAALDLAYTETPTIDLTAQLVPQGEALPADVAAVVGERLDLALSAGQPEQGRFVLDKLALQSALVEAQGDAVASMQGDEVDGRITVTIADLAKASGLAGTDLAGEVVLTIAAAGSFNDPALDVTLQGTGLAAANFAMAELSSRFDVGLLAPIDAGFAGADLAGEARFAGLTLDGAPLPVEDDLKLNVEAHLPMQGQASLQRLELTGDHVQARATGEIAMPELEGTAKLEATVASLADLLDALGDRAPAGLDLQGEAGLTAEAAIAPGAKTIEADLALTTQGLAGLPADAGAVVGSEPSLRTHMVFEQGRMVALRDIVLEAQEVRASGEVSLGLDEAQALDGRLTLDVPDLAALEPLARQPIAGDADLTVTAAGTLAAPQIDLDGEVVDLAVAGQAIERLELQASVSDAAVAPEGDVVLSAVQNGRDLSVRTGYALDGDTLSLNDLALSGPATDLGGSLTIDLATTTAQGRVQGRVEDLSALEPWTGQPLAGSLSLDARLDAPEGRQNAELSLEVPTLEGDFGRASQLKAEARVTDAMNDAGIDGSVTLGRFEQPDLVVTAAQIDLGGKLSSLDVEATARGTRAGDPFDVAAAATVEALGAPLKVVLNSFSGEAAGQDFVLQSPATVVLDDGTLDIDRLDLLVGDAQIQGDAQMGQGRIEAKVRLARTPLSTFAAFGMPPAAGTAQAALSIEGPTAAPIVALELDLDQVRPADPFYAEKGGFSAVLTSRLAGGSLEARAELTGAADEPSVATVTIPVRLSLEPFAFELADRAPLKGAVDAKADLGQLAALLPLDGQRIDGRMTADLSIGGRLDAPRLDGAVQLADGAFQDSISGVVLKSVRLRLEAEGTGLTIAEFDARDGDAGRIGLTGGVDLAGASGLRYDLALTSKEMRVLDNDLGRAYVSADLALDGGADRGRLSGTVTVDRANLQIPSGGGIDPVTLDVTAVGSERPPESRARPPPSDTSPADTSTGGYVLALSVDVEVPARLFVRGRGLDTEWGGSLDIEGTASAPEIAGSIDYRRGFLDFLDRRFDIREGHITFTGGAIPDLALTAAAQGETLTAIVQISGPATKPEFSLDSEPSRPNDEILADLLFNRDISEITPAQGIRLAAAIRTLEGGGTDTLGKVRDAIGLDTLDVGGDNPGEATAKAGKYIADNVFLEVERGLASGSGKAKVEIELNDNFSVNTEVDENAQSGVGIEWSLDY